jgi:hypothetical protein
MKKWKSKPYLKKSSIIGEPLIQPEEVKEVLEALEIQAWQMSLGLTESQARNLIQVRKEEEKRAEKSLRLRWLDELQMRRKKLKMLYEMPARISPKMRMLEIEYEKKRIRELLEKIQKLPTLELQL